MTCSYCLYRGKRRSQRTSYLSIWCRWAMGSHRFLNSFGWQLSVIQARRLKLSVHLAEKRVNYDAYRCNRHHFWSVASVHHTTRYNLRRNTVLATACLFDGTVAIGRIVGDSDHNQLRVLSGPFWNFFHQSSWTIILNYHSEKLITDNKKIQWKSQKIGFHKKNSWRQKTLKPEKKTYISGGAILNRMPADTCEMHWTNWRASFWRRFGIMTIHLFNSTEMYMLHLPWKAFCQLVCRSVGTLYDLWRNKWNSKNWNQNH